MPTGGCSCNFAVRGWSLAARQYGFVRINVLYARSKLANLHFSLFAHLILSDIFLVSYNVYYDVYVHSTSVRASCSKLEARNTSVVTNIRVTSTIKMNIFQIFAAGTYTHVSPEYISFARLIPMFSPRFWWSWKCVLKNCELQARAKKYFYFIFTYNKTLVFPGEKDYGKHSVLW